MLVDKTHPDLVFEYLDLRRKVNAVTGKKIK